MSGLKLNHTKIEDAIIEHLKGEVQESALQFVAHLNENQLIPIMRPGSDYGKIPYDGHYLGWVRLEPNKWYFEIFNFLNFHDFNDEDEEFKQAVYDHVDICSAPCHDQCWRAKDVKIFGKEFKSVCSQHSHSFENPDNKTIKHIKKLIEYSKKTKPYPQQYHPNNL